MLKFRPGNLLWCTDHLDVGTVLRAEPNDDGEIFLEVLFSSGLTCITSDEESHEDYRRSRRRNGIWEFAEGDVWSPIDFSKSCLIDKPPTFDDDPDVGPLPDVGPDIDLEPYREEGGSLSDEDG